MDVDVGVDTFVDVQSLRLDFVWEVKALAKVR